VLNRDFKSKQLGENGFQILPI